MKTHYYYCPLVEKTQTGTPHELFLVKIYKYRKGVVTQVNTSIEKNPIHALAEARTMVNNLNLPLKAGWRIRKKHQG